MTRSLMVEALESEKAILGTAMMDPQTWPEIRDSVKVGDFSRQLHADIFALLSRMNEKAPAADMPAVTDEWARQGRPVDDVGYISSLPESANPEALPRYIATVAEAACRRRLLTTALKLQEAAREADDIQEALAQGEAALQALAGSVSPDAWVSQRDLVEKQWAEYAKRSAAVNAGSVAGITTGYLDLDKITGGLRPGELIILAARPAMGKTALALNIAMRSVRKARVPVAIYSKEMPMGSCFDRTMASEAKVSAELIRDGISSRDVAVWGRLSDAAEEMGSLPLWWADVALRVSALRSLSRRLKGRVPTLGLLVVDYLQLLEPESEDKRQQREVQVASMSRGLKAMAKELEIPVICLAQLNRGVEARSDKRPGLADLRESGSIEQDADQVWFIYRDDYYKADSESVGTAEVIVAKNRSGRCGTVQMAWKPEHQTFTSIDRRDERYL